MIRRNENIFTSLKNVEFTTKYLLDPEIRHLVTSIVKICPSFTRNLNYRGNPQMKKNMCAIHIIKINKMHSMCKIQFQFHNFAYSKREYS